MSLFFFFFNNWFFGFFFNFIYLFMAALGLRLRARALSSRGKRGPLLIAVHGPLTIAASPVAEHRLQTRRLSNCGSRAQSLRGMWDPPRPGLEPVFPALAGRPSTTAPPGKPQNVSFFTCANTWIKVCQLTLSENEFKVLLKLFFLYLPHARIKAK